MCRHSRAGGNLKANRIRIPNPIAIGLGMTIRVKPIYLFFNNS
jgi:hypothetical protein